ncbi:hypothetical protein HJC23_013339 [Cyclotella cryptica]|uniref:DUF6824 domain-containing protein n=1 Tax=Cyclotella cryptica TaxID=29204 RepID=A0ABD3Q1B5_9STRA|eukprot:CCRYP_009748-RA/>CCRYP_009748-RA protein AED:0.05 eAED:0.05 QI:468/1/1/1/0.5/0.33/3/982/771
MSNYPTTNISNPGPHDILCGRGGGTNAHPGNIKFRKLVAAHKLRYLAASKSDKPGVAREVVKEWRNLNPPGRFLAKMDEGNEKDDGREQSVLWHDVGDKKAREKASQCLRERNGAANEAVQALVKTVTANGEACPEDYATLMNKAAMVKARNDIALQQQKDMLAQMTQMAEFNNNFGGNGMGSNADPQPYGLSENVLNEFSKGGSDSGGGYKDFSNRPNNNAGVFNSDNFQQFDQFQQHSNQNQNQQYCNLVNNFQSEDDLLEAEIKRVLQQKQAQLQMAAQNQQRLGNDRGNNMVGVGSGNIGGGIGMNNRGGYNNPPQPYMGEESIMKEYRQLMQKQHQMNMGNLNGVMGNMGNMNGMNGGFNGMNGINSQMNVPQSMRNDPEDWIWSVANGRSNNMGSTNIGPNNMLDVVASLGFNNANNNNNMFCQPAMNSMGNSGGMQDRGTGSPNNDAARNYLNRLRTMRKGDNHPSNPGGTFSGGNSGMMGGLLMNEQTSSSMVGDQGAQAQTGSSGRTGGGQRGFTIEEYQASLQEFLANDGDGGFNNNARKSTTDQDSNNNFKNNLGEGVNVYQVPTSLGDKKSTSRGGRDSMQSSGPFARNTFQSVDSNCQRKSFESVDDMDVRPTFRSVDTMDMMSITNSINDIVDDDVLRNPELREKYSRRMSQNTENSRYHNFEVATLEVKTMDHGQGGGGGPKKIKKAIDPRLVAMSGTRQSVQTKEADGPSARRNSMASVDSRMSFGNMSCMSELTDFGDLMTSVGNDGEYKDLKL